MRPRRPCQARQCTIVISGGMHAFPHRGTAQVGYLYLTDAPRLHQLMAHLGISGDASEGRAAISL